MNRLLWQMKVTHPLAAIIYSRFTYPWRFTCVPSVLTGKFVVGTSSTTFGFDLIRNRFLYSWKTAQVWMIFQNIFQNGYPKRWKAKDTVPINWTQNHRKSKSRSTWKMVSPRRRTCTVQAATQKACPSAAVIGISWLNWKTLQWSLLENKWTVYPTIIPCFSWISKILDLVMLDYYSKEQEIPWTTCFISLEEKRHFAPDILMESYIYQAKGLLKLLLNICLRRLHRLPLMNYPPFTYMDQAQHGTTQLETSVLT